MEEIKRRTNSILIVLQKKATTGYPYTDAEYICLQFRKILELIALANLVSNKDEYSKQHHNFARHYHAKHIIKDIEKINPNFYPIPSEQIIDKKTGKVEEVVPIKSGYLTKSEFISAYDCCSDLLHAENPFDKKKNLDQYTNSFKTWHNKIIKLLNHHQVQLIDPRKQIWVVMKGREDGRAQASLFERQ